MTTTYYGVRYCPQCNLVYRPDPRQHIDPEVFCPRCGYELVKETAEEDDN